MKNVNGDVMTKAEMSRAQASLELAIWQADAEAMSSSDLYIWLRESGLPSEVAIRMKELVNLTARIGAKTVQLGRVLLAKIIEFIKKHKNLATGVALGAAISSLVSAIPLFGPLLTPIVLPLGMAIGAIAGHRVDKATSGVFNDDTTFVSIAQDVIEIAREFFEAFIATIRAMADELVMEERDK